MNPKKEFVNAIMSVLRLEQNIYVTASIEELIDRLDIKDYTMFIAYLGERKSDYEKPIQSIAKAVDEFYEKKHKPTLTKLRRDSRAISALFRSVGHSLDNSMENIDIKRLSEKIKKAISVCIKDVVCVHGASDDIWVLKEDMMPSITNMGGIDFLASIFVKDCSGFDKYIEENIGTEIYCLPSITDKIEKDAKEKISENVLALIGVTK